MRGEYGTLICKGLLVKFKQPKTTWGPDDGTSAPVEDLEWDLERMRADEAKFNAELDAYLATLP